ncbi:hypothetical protein ACF0H5_003433 [Mactra antiquata]
MRKYRFSDPNSTKVKLRGLSQVLKFLFVWNVGGYLLYKYYKGKAKESDPHFDEKPTEQKLVTLYGYNTDNVKKVNINISSKGFKIKQEDNTEQNDKID